MHDGLRVDPPGPHRPYRRQHQPVCCPRGNAAGRNRLVPLALMSAQFPLVQASLTAKLVGLGVYVALGSLALRRNASVPARRIAFAAALLAVGYVVAVAL